MTDPRPPFDVSAFRAAAEEFAAKQSVASPGPWHVEQSPTNGLHGVVPRFFPVSPGITQCLSSREDAELMALARNTPLAELALGACERIAVFDRVLARLQESVGADLDRLAELEAAAKERGELRKEVERLRAELAAERSIPGEPSHDY